MTQSTEINGFVDLQIMIRKLSAEVTPKGVKKTEQ